MKRVVVGGLEGRMGSFLVEALKVEEDITLVAGVSEVECLCLLYTSPSPRDS